jgi:hypothetical protein
LRIFQIYFHESQRAQLDYVPYFNSASDCTVYFESSVIKRLVESGAHAGSDYFGVVSHQLREKLRYTADAWRNNGEIANTSVRAFTPEDFEQELRSRSPDAMSFQRHVPHDPITLADRFHPNFSHHFRRVMSAIGYGWTPTPFATVFYFNYFVAKADVYERYVREMLAPAMSVMDHMPELMGNSHYPNPLPEPLRASFGVPFYPYHPFLCERLFSYFAHLHGLKCAEY